MVRVGWKLYNEGAMNAERFVEFVRGIIERHNLRGYLFLFDNAGAHKGQGIRELIEQTGNTFSYTIPYNPQTNAIEAWFSQFKHYMESSRIRDIEGIRNECRETIRKILPQHYRNYFQYAYRKNTYPRRERNRESTRRRPSKAYKVGGAQ
jgi:transposase